MDIADIAQVVHEAVRAIQRVTDDPQPSPAWDDADPWQHQAAIDGVRHALGGQTPEQSHETWCADKAAAGWVWGPVKDAEATPKTHPCLIPYGQLDAAQKAKDAALVALVGILATVNG